MKDNCLRENCVFCTAKAPLFKLMSVDELEKIQETRFEVTFMPNEVIYKQGTKTTQIVSITGGLAKTYIEGYNSKNFILELIKPTSLMSGPGSYIDYKHHFSLKAVENTSCCFFDLDTFKEIVRNNPDLSELIIKMSSQKAIDYYKRFISLTQKQVNGRVAENLIYLKNSIYCRNPMDLTISYQDIAEMTGMTKDTVGRVLKEFCNEKLIEIDNNRITVINENILSHISEFG